jgi:hypothetical protein
MQKMDHLSLRPAEACLKILYVAHIPWLAVERDAAWCYFSYNRCWIIEHGTVIDYLDLHHFGPGILS